MSGLERIRSEAAASGLCLLGHAPEGDATVALLGPAPGFWEIFRTSPEFADGRRDPLDRWSKRVIGGMARALGARAVFPSDGPPYPPVFSWALKSGRFWQSPVGMLVHERHGLMVSIRGALILPGPLPSAPARPNPCLSCADRPCTAACPAGALTEKAPFDVSACHDFLDTAEGRSSCYAQGCLARLACPLSAGAGRVAEQSAFHMRAYHPEKDP